MTDTLTQQKQLEDLLLSEDLNELNYLTSEFNMFNALKLQNNEIRHSNLLSWLLSPFETHKLGDYFVKEFLMSAIRAYSQKDEISISLSDIAFKDFSDIDIKREYKNIDLLLVSSENKLVCVVENKIWTGEHDCQLERYADIINSEFKDYKKLYIYLAPVNICGSELLNRTYENANEEVYYIPMNYEQVHDVIEKTLHFKSNMMAQDVKMFLDHYNKMIERDIMGIQNKEIIDLCRKIYRANKDAIDLICSCNNIKDVIIESIQDLYVNDLISLKKDGMFAVKSLKNNINLQIGDSKYGSDLVLLQIEKGSNCFNFCINIVPAKNGFEAKRKEVVDKINELLDKKLIGSNKENEWCYYCTPVIKESEYYNFDDLEQVKTYLKSQIDNTNFISMLKNI
mgnify:CR=1 FL=1